MAAEEGKWQEPTSELGDEEFKTSDESPLSTRPETAASTTTHSTTTSGPKSGSDKGMQVFCRFRPFSASPGKEALVVEYDGTGSGVTVQHPVSGRFVPFAFQGVFPPQTLQRELYAAVGKPVLDAACSGFNGAIICYGQTASGKTHTMFGPPKDGKSSVQPSMSDAMLKGLIPRIMEDLFQRVDSLPGGMKATVKVSFVEIYMENVVDLLVRHRPKLTLRDFGDYCVTNASEVSLACVDDFIRLIEYGNENRSTATTAANARSSRSHAIVQVMLCIEDKRAKPVMVQNSILNLVDLAGSERYDQSGSNSDRLAEARLINTSLNALGSVITALSAKKKKRGRAGTSHIPYRASKLTRLLKSSFGGNTRTHLVVNAGLDADSFKNTISTLRYGDAAALIKNKPVANIMKSSAALRRELTAAQMLDKAQTMDIQAMQLVLSRLQTAASELIPRRVSTEAQRDELFRRFPSLQAADPTLQFFRLLPAFVMREILSFCPGEVVACTSAVCTSVRKYVQVGRGACDFWVSLCRRDFEDWSPPLAVIRGTITEEVTTQIRQQYYAKYSEPYLKALAEKEEHWQKQKSGLYAQVGSGATANAELDKVMQLPTRHQLEHAAHFDRAEADARAQERAKLGGGGVTLRSNLNLK